MFSKKQNFVIKLYFKIKLNYFLYFNFKSFIDIYVCMYIMYIILITILNLTRNPKAETFILLLVISLNYKAYEKTSTKK